MQYRYYQVEAHDAAIAEVRKTTEPCLIEAATGAGKSHIIAKIADTLYRLSNGKNVLCLAPSAKLVKQNREKFLKTGKPASIFSASAGSKCLRHPVVFATPGTVKNSLAKFIKNICAVLVDEAHGMTPTVREIIDTLRQKNPQIRVIGLTATPFVRNKGYIFRIFPDGAPVSEDMTEEPYFTKCVYRIRKAELEEQGFLTPALVGSICAEQYDLSGLPKRAALSEEVLDRVYLGQGRKTALICADLVNQCRDRKSVMIFAATVRHALEIAESLPPHLTRVVGGEINTARKAREVVEEDFAAGRFKYLVSVGTMTTGVDFPNVDAIVVLRYTESLTLLEQIIGRGSRTLPGKKDFLLLDYADNLERHYGEEIDLYNPEIRTIKSKDSSGVVPSACASCGTVNQFAARPNPDQLAYDDEGYFVDLAGLRIETEHGPMPGHFGRRCTGMMRIGGKYEQCAHRWTDKKCPDCGNSNDIAARYCGECKVELVDPNEKLVIEFRKRKKDATQVQCDRVLEIVELKTVSQKGDDCLKVTFQTEYRKVETRFNLVSDNRYLRGKLAQFEEAKAVGIKTVTYHKNARTGFFEIHGYNEAEDVCEKV